VTRGTFSGYISIKTPTENRFQNNIEITPSGEGLESDPA